MTTRASDTNPRHGSTDIEIVERDYDHPDAVELVRALFDEQVERYGYADPADADPRTYQPPDGLFIVAYQAGGPVACGGYRPYAPDTATIEIKKMYTVPHLRDHGIGKMIITYLEGHARRHGARWAILETGVRNHGALALYQHGGYEPTDRYVPGRDPAINRAFIKELASAEQPRTRALRTNAR